MTSETWAFWSIPTHNMHETWITSLCRNEHLLKLRSPHSPHVWPSCWFHWWDLAFWPVAKWRKRWRHEGKVGPSPWPQAQSCYFWSTDWTDSSLGQFELLKYYSIQLAELLMLRVSCYNFILFFVKFFRCPRDKGSHRIGELQIQHFRIEAGGSNWISHLQHW